MAIPFRVGRLAWIAPELFPEPGGIGNQAAFLVRELQAIGYEVSVVADTSMVSEAEAFQYDQQQPYRVQRIFRRRPVLFVYLKRCYRLWQSAKKHEVIVCSGKWPIWLGGFMTALFPKKEWIAVVHGSELDLKGGLQRWYMSRSIQRFAKIIAVSKYTADHLPKFTRRNQPKVRVIGNGVSTEEFSSVTMNGYSAGELGFPALITVGSVKERKGQRKVIEALPEIRKKYPEATYHVVGLPHESAALRKLADRLGLNGAVKFYGAQSREKVQHLLKASDIFLLPSQHTQAGDFEGYGIAILEANALGVPAIASSKSGSSDAVTQQSGILLDDASPEALTDAVSNILDRADAYAQGALAFSDTRNWKRVAQAYHEFIQA